jgi:molybdopterin converting factor small subunit
MRTATRTGTVRVRFFASYADLAGCETAAVELRLPATVGDVVRRVREQLPGARVLPERPLTAVNLRHVKLDAPVSDGDEVALLPPLAGG